MKSLLVVLVASFFSQMVVADQWDCTTTVSFIYRNPAPIKKTIEIDAAHFAATEGEEVFNTQQIEYGDLEPYREDEVKIRLVQNSIDFSSTQKVSTLASNIRFSLVATVKGSPLRMASSVDGNGEKLNLDLYGVALTKDLPGNDYYGSDYVRVFCERKNRLKKASSK